MTPWTRLTVIALMSVVDSTWTENMPTCLSSSAIAVFIIWLKTACGSVSSVPSDSRRTRDPQPWRRFPDAWCYPPCGCVHDAGARCVLSAAARPHLSLTLTTPTMHSITCRWFFSCTLYNDIRLPVNRLLTSAFLQMESRHKRGPYGNDGDPVNMLSDLHDSCMKRWSLTKAEANVKRIIRYKVNRKPACFRLCWWHIVHSDMHMLWDWVWHSRVFSSACGPGSDTELLLPLWSH